MKLNINKISYLLLCSIGIALGIFTSAVSLLTTYNIYSYAILFTTYYLVIKMAKAIRKYPIFTERNDIAK